MTSRHAAYIALTILFASGSGFAEPDEDDTRSLSLHCRYSDYKTFHIEKASIGKAKGQDGTAASSKVFRKGIDPQDVTYIVTPGQIAECIFPSGNRIRAKVGEGQSRAYGMCGADPMVFASIWVNERKVASREWFAGHCREYSDIPDVSFEYLDLGRSRSPSVKKCNTQTTNQLDTSDSDTTSKPKQPLSVCVDFPDISRLPRDALEYPHPNQKTPNVGEVELLSGSHNVCQSVLQELRSNFYAISQYWNQKEGKLRSPRWSASSVELPKELAGSQESIFDLDNDGKLDRVFIRDFESNYMDASVLLVQRGTSSSELKTQGAAMDKGSSLLPCQMGKEKHEIRNCPPFSQKSDDAGFSMHGRDGEDPIHFRARYSRISPFIFQRESFLGVNSTSEATQDFVAVLKPEPNGTFQPMCLFGKITENF
jgi:hypothetical protein